METTALTALRVAYYAARKSNKTGAFTLSLYKQWRELAKQC